MKLPIKWIALGIVAILSIGVLSMVEWTPASATGNTLTVYVKDGGVPVSGATVRITGPSIQLGTTDASGRIQFIGLDAGTYSIRAIYAPFTAVQSITLVSSTAITLDFTGPPIIPEGYGVIKGKTFSHDGNHALPNVRVIAIRTTDEYTRTSVSDANADYSLTLPTGTYKVYATYYGYLSITKSISVNTDSITISNHLILNAAATITLTVNDDITQNEIVGAQLIISGGTYASNADGIIQINDWTTGVYQYSLSKLGYFSISGEFTITQGANTFTLSMSPNGFIPGISATITGHITKLDGSPITGATIIFADSDIYTTLSLEDGSYLIYVPAGKYSISAQAIGFNQTYYNGEGASLNVEANDIITNINIRLPEDSDGDEIPIDWIPTIILGAIGGIVFLVTLLVAAIKSNPLYIFLGVVILVICAVAGLMLSLGIISLESSEIIITVKELIKWQQ